MRAPGEAPDPSCSFSDLMRSRGTFECHWHLRLTQRRQDVIEFVGDVVNPLPHAQVGDGVLTLMDGREFRARQAEGSTGAFVVASLNTIDGDACEYERELNLDH